MRTADIGDYLKLRRLVRNPWQALWFRKNRNPHHTLVVQLIDEAPLYLRGGRQDYHIFRRMFLLDEYRLNGHAPGSWECVVDVGANVGLFARRVAPLARKVVCYEPLADNFAQLRKNTDGCPKITARREAVAGRAGTVSLYHPKKASMSGLYSLYHQAGIHASDASEEVVATDLDTVFDQHDIESCDLLKIDAEGAEYDILYAASNDTLSRIARIHGEYHDVAAHDERTRIDALTSYLRRNGFAVETRAEPRIPNHGLFFAHRARA